MLKAVQTPATDLPILSARNREKGCFRGVVSAIVYDPANRRKCFQADLFDGQATLRLIWLGQEKVAGISPGVKMRVSGLVTTVHKELVIYNPRYTLLSPETLD